METEVRRKKLKGCGFLSFLCRRPSSKKLIPGRKPSLSSSPAKASPPTSIEPQRRSSQLVVRKVLPTENGVSGKLDRDKLVRASSGNVMLYGQLGNIWGRKKETSPKVPVLCRDLSKRMDPEKLKERGNEEFKNGRLGEALALYNKAITIDPGKASYWSNKAAALAGMGRLIEAVGECKEAVRIDPSYSRAHHRLATLYLRLGETERAVYHYKQSSKDNNLDDVSKALNLQMHIVRSNEARKLKDWQNMLVECQSAISGGADSAPKVFASQAEALLRLGRHEEADTVLKGAPKFQTDAIRNLFGPAVIGYILMVQAEVDLASGRKFNIDPTNKLLGAPNALRLKRFFGGLFDEAVKFAEMACQDQKDREITEVVRRARAVAFARNKGNELFKASKYREACTAYGVGLDHDPLNVVLLCNRAACLSKLHQWEKAIDECNVILNLRPSYAKARLRRADCFAKLEKWEASEQDYQILMMEFPKDKEVSKALLNARSHLQRK